MNNAELTKVKSLAHDINTPLTTVLGYLSLIKKKSSDKDVLVWLANIRTAVLKVSEYSKEITELVSK